MARTWKFSAILSSGYIVIPAGGTANIPDGWPATNRRVLVEGHAYNDIRFSYLGLAGKIRIMVASTSTTFSYIEFDTATGKITNDSSAAVTIVQIHVVTVN